MSQERLASNVGKYAQRYAPVRAPRDVTLIGRGRLRGWRFTLDLYSARQGCRVANIVRADDDEVWGAVYALDSELVHRSDGQRSVLDRIEGHRTERDPPNYEPAIMTVEVSGVPRRAHTYVGRSDARQRCAAQHANAPIAEDYGHAILQGARELELPASYRRLLMSVVRVDDA